MLIYFTWLSIPEKQSQALAGGIENFNFQVGLTWFAKKIQNTKQAHYEVHRYI